MISLIACIGKNRELGKDGDLIFHLAEDMKYFRETTMGHKIVMGRKTWESLPGKLPGRTNIVVSRSWGKVGDDITTGNKANDGVDIANNDNNDVASTGDSEPDAIVSDLKEFVDENCDTDEEIFVIGGGMLYWETLRDAKKLYLTEVDAVVEADTFFPEFQKDEWVRTVIKEGEDDGVRYAFVVYERK